MEKKKKARKSDGTSSGELRKFSKFTHCSQRARRHAEQRGHCIRFALTLRCLQHVLCVYLGNKIFLSRFNARVSAWVSS